MLIFTLLTLLFSSGSASTSSTEELFRASVLTLWRLGFRSTYHSAFQTYDLERDLVDDGGSGAPTPPPDADQRDSLTAVLAALRCP